MALDARPGAHADGGRLALLAELLGVAERHSELLLRRARAALVAGDLAAAREHAADLAAQGYVPAWDVAAQARLILSLSQLWNWIKLCIQRSSAANTGKTNQ